MGKDVPQRLWSQISPKLPQAWRRWLLMFLCTISVTFLHREGNHSFQNIAILEIDFSFNRGMKYHNGLTWNINTTRISFWTLCGTTTWTKIEVKIKMVWPLLVESCIFTSFPAQILAVQLRKFVARQGRDFHIVPI